MKKILVLALTLVVALSMTACGGKVTPTSTVDDFFKAIKAEDSKAVAEVYEDKSVKFLDEMNSTKKSGDKMEEEFAKAVKEKIFDFDYKLSKEKIDGNKATVKASITTYNLGDAMKAVMGKAMAIAMDTKLSKKEIDEKILKIVKTEFDKAKKDYKKDVTIELVKKDDKWVVKKMEQNHDFFDALSGGIMSTLGGGL